ncbi:MULTISPECIES: hypothetical protein [Bacilli]|uniref:hypothetical protein n=1 Tax=Bacilli TaxID=91061 RepID=UPI00255614D6|nr:hypothetical protein [Streptococcus agalactiae]MDK8746884.1 hypothetical protein [Streptococcus agalactiae]
MKQYLTILLVLGVLVGGMYVYKSFTNNDKSLENSKIQKEQEETDSVPIQRIDDEIKEKTLKTAEKFLEAYINYDSENPADYVDKMKPYVTEEFFIGHVQNPKREPLEVKTYRIGELHISVAESTEHVGVSLSDEITVFGEVHRLKTTTDNKEIEEYKEYWLVFDKYKNDYLIKGIDIQDGTGHEH